MGRSYRKRGRQGESSGTLADPAPFFVGPQRIRRRTIPSRPKTLTISDHPEGYVTCLGHSGHRVTMKGLRALQRRRLRANRGFTLIELMVVVILIAVFAALASPSFRDSRDDRTAFDYARQYQQLLVQGRARAAGTGSAHLAVLGTSGRGFIRLYAALDGTAAPTGPAPVASCKADLNQWNEAQSDPPNLNGTRAKFIDGTNLNRPGVNEDMELKSRLLNGGGAEVQYLAICITPSGVTYVGAGDSPAIAINAMRGSSPFNGTVEAQISRNRGAVRTGLLRRVMITGGGAPRLRSE